jgi:hypothetical protein
MKFILQPRNAKEAEKRIAGLITDTLAESGNRIHSYAWHAITSWSNKIFRAFELIEYYLENIYAEDQEHVASMRPNKQLDLDGLSVLIPGILY